MVVSEEEEGFLSEESRSSDSDRNGQKRWCISLVWLRPEHPMTLYPMIPQRTISVDHSIEINLQLKVLLLMVYGRERGGDVDLR